MKWKSYLLQEKIDENKSLTKENLNLKEEVHGIKKAIKSLKKTNCLNILTLNKLENDLGKLGGKLEIKRQGIINTFCNKHLYTLEQHFF